MVSGTVLFTCSTDVGVKLLAHLGNRLLSDGGFEMFAPAGIVDAPGTSDPAGTDQLNLKSPELDMGTGHAAVLAVSRLGQVGLVQLASGHHASRTATT